MIAIISSCIIDEILLFLYLITVIDMEMKKKFFQRFYMRRSCFHCPEAKNTIGLHQYEKYFFAAYISIFGMLPGTETVYFKLKTKMCQLIFWLKFNIIFTNKQTTTSHCDIYQIRQSQNAKSIFSANIIG